MTYSILVHTPADGAVGAAIASRFLAVSALLVLDRAGIEAAVAARGQPGP